MFFATARKKRDMAAAIHVSAVGSRGKPRDVKKQIEELQKET